MLLMEFFFHVNYYWIKNVRICIILIAVDSGGYAYINPGKFLPLVLWIFIAYWNLISYSDIYILSVSYSHDCWCELKDKLPVLFQIDCTMNDCSSFFKDLEQVVDLFVHMCNKNYSSFRSIRGGWIQSS